MMYKIRVGGRILVLGFDSPQLNDLQDRLLRETIIRALHDKGHPIVPVMEIESLFYTSSIRQIRRLTPAAVRGLCDELNAGSACYGSINAETGRDNQIREGKRYICSIVYFRRDENKFYDLRFVAIGQKRLDRFFTSLAGEIVARIGGIR